MAHINENDFLVSKESYEDGYVHINHRSIAPNLTDRDLIQTEHHDISEIETIDYKEDSAKPVLSPCNDQSDGEHWLGRIIDDEDDGEDGEDTKSSEAVEGLNGQGDEDDWRSGEVFKEDDEVSDDQIKDDVEMGDVSLEDLLNLENDGAEDVDDEIPSTIPFEYLVRPSTPANNRPGTPRRIYPRFYSSNSIYASNSIYRHSLFFNDRPSQPPNFELPQVEAVQTEARLTNGEMALQNHRTLGLWRCKQLSKLRSCWTRT